MQDMKRTLTNRFIWFQIIAFASFAPMNYYSVYLKEIGMDSRQIGMWAAVTGVITLLTLPLWGFISDKIRSPKKTYLISMLVYAALFALLPAAGRAMATSALPLYALIVLYSLVKQPTHSLQDAWFIGTTRPHGIDYSSLRLWGSFGFAVVSVGIGLTVEFTGIEPVFYLAGVFVLPLAVMCVCFKDKEYALQPHHAAKGAPKLRPWVLFKNYYFVTALIMVFVLSIYGALTVSFYAFILEHAGLKPQIFGLISGYGAFVQVFILLFIAKRCQRTPVPRLLIIGGLFGVLENLTYGVATGLPTMFLAATFWAVTISIFVSVLPTYIYSLVPRQYLATAQTLIGSAAMVLVIIGNLVSGYLVATIGIANYNFCVAGLQLLLILLFAASIPFGRRVLKIRAEGEEDMGAVVMEGESPRDR
jgi:MFS transporter, PPP family, 3-phenylpropionic acid transporter